MQRFGEGVRKLVVTAKDVKEGKISVQTPIAQGLLGKKVGDIVEIKIPHGTVQLEILNISFE